MPISTAIAPHDLDEHLSSGRDPRILDVRTPVEFETAHIAGAYNVPLDLLREHRDEIARHLDEEVILVCRSGARATAAQECLHAAGLSNVHILDGGMTAWTASGLQVVEGRQRWDLERQVRLVSGSVVLAGILSSVFAPNLKWLAAAIGAGLSVAALTNTCAMGMALSKLPYNQTANPDAESVIAQLIGP